VINLLSTVAIELILIFFVPVIGSEWIRKHQRLSQWSLKRWWTIFLCASFVDVGSTYVVIYIRSLPWTTEYNLLVSNFGPLIGYNNIMLGYNVLVILMLYFIACINHPPKRYNFFIWFMCVASGVRFGAAICNMILVW